MVRGLFWTWWALALVSFFVLRPASFDWGAAAAPCIQDPSNPSCANYTMPTDLVQKGINTNCGSMPNMAGCTVQHICASSSEGTIHNSVYCHEFSILKDLCLDMPGMSGCNNYTSMCSNVSVVQECGMAALPLPKTMWISNTVESLCASMPDMQPCGKCKKQGMMLNCDLLQVYSDICMSMYMDGCQEWQNLCKTIPDWPICGAKGSKEMPMMRMYFHASLLDYVLFEQWVPRNGWQYTLTVIAIIIFGIFYEFLKVCRSIYEGYVSQRKPNVEFLGIDDVTNGNATNATRGRLGWDWKVELVRASIACLETAVGLLLMLVAMTFNVGLFLAVCAGTFFGSLFFGHFANAAHVKHGCH